MCIIFFSRFKTIEKLLLLNFYFVLITLLSLSLSFPENGREHAKAVGVAPLSELCKQIEMCVN